jgi:hypothetical protein
VPDGEDDVAHAFRVAFEADGTVRYDGTHVVPPRSDRRLGDELPERRWRVTVRDAVTDVDAGEGTRSRSPSRTFDADGAVGLDLHYSERHGLRTTSDAPVDACGSASEGRWAASRGR